MNGRKYRLIMLVALIVTIALLAVAAYWSLHRSPPAEDYGQAVRLLYIHIPSAMNTFVGFLVAAIASAVYLARRNEPADRLARSAVLTALVMATIMLVTGMIFARIAWSQWWDFRSPKLMTSLLMWLLLVGYFLLRNGLPQGNRRRRVAAAYCLLASVVVPLVYFSNRIIGTDIHQRSTTFDHADMTMALRLSMLAISAAHAWLLVFLYRLRRPRQ